VCDIETSRIGAPYIYDISSLRVKGVLGAVWKDMEKVFYNRVLMSSGDA